MQHCPNNFMNFLSSFHNKSLALLLIRVALGAVFIYHGWDKITDITGTMGFFATIGFSGAFWAYLVAYVEFVGGILMLLGVRVREVGVLFVAIMIVAIYAVHFKNGFSVMNGGYEYQFTLLLTSLAMIFAGAGKYTVLKETSPAMMCKPCEKNKGTCKC